MSIASTVGSSVESIFHQVSGRLSSAMPGILAAIVLLSFGYFLGLLLGTGLQKLLEMTKICEVLIRKAKVKHFMGETQLSGFFGTILKWYVFILFLSPAADFVQLRSLSFFLENVALWVPRLIVAILLTLFGLLFAEYVAVHLRAIRAKGTHAMAHIAKIVILTFTTILALQQIGVNVSFASNVVLIVVGGVMLGIAIALGMGFGAALKPEARQLIRTLKRKL